MKIIKSYLIALLITGLFYLNTACKKTEYVLPDCIAYKIEQIKQEPVRNPPASVWMYIHMGRVYYYIPPFCCDQYSILMDENCRIICAPGGGITGHGSGNCPGFVSKLSKGILIWRDER